MMKTPMTPPMAVRMTSHNPMCIPLRIPTHLRRAKRINPTMAFTARYLMALKRMYIATTMMMTRISAPKLKINGIDGTGRGSL